MWSIGLFCSTLVGCEANSVILGVHELPQGEPLLADAEVFVVQGADQEAEVATVLPDPIVVEVRDSSGTIFAQTPVEWVFRQGKGAPAGSANIMADTVIALTDGFGRASVTWQLDTAAGEQMVSVRIMQPEEAPSLFGGPSTAPGSESTSKLVSARGRPGAIKTIAITPDVPSLVLGGWVRLIAVARDKWGNAVQPQPTFTWSTTSAAVASVDNTGLVSAAGDGTATIRAESGSITGSETVTVIAPPRVVAEVRLSPAGATVAVGDTARFTVTALDSAGQSMPTTGVAWGFTNQSVGSVDATGLVTALGPGSEWVWATVAGVTGSQPVTVPVPPGDPAAVGDLQVVASTPSTVTLRWTQVDDGTGAPADYLIRRATPTISWESAGGSEAGLPGSQVGTTIEFTCTGLESGTPYQFQVMALRGSEGGEPSNVASATTVAEVRVVAEVRLTPALASLTVGDTVRFTVTAVDSTGVSIPITDPVAWSFTDLAVGTVSTTGLVTAVAVGAAQVRATVAGVTGAASVTVNPAVTNPATVSDVQVLSTTETSVTLRWTQVTNGAGGAASYAIRRGSPTISWASAAGTEVSVAGTQVGTTIQYTWTGLTAGSTHQFQLRAYRGTLGVDAILGVLSSVVSATLPSSPTPGVLITQSGGTTSAIEGGATDAFTIRLQSQPASNVVLTVASANTAEATASPGTLTFTSASWSTNQNVTAAAVNDTADDGDLVTTVTVSVNDAASDDAYDGVANQTLTVTTIDNDAAAPPPPPTGRTVYFHSDWSTATGNSVAAFTDSNKAKRWTGYAGTLVPGGKSSVRSSAADGRDYPTTNYLRVHNDAPANDNWAELYFDATDNFIPAPQIGDSIGLRFYYRVTLPNSWNNDSETHGTYFVDRGNGGYGWGPGALGLYQWTYTDGTWNYVMTMGDAVSPAANVYWQRPDADANGANRLQKNTTYRIEWLYIRTGTDTYQVRSRVYNAAGTLIIDSNQLVNDFWTGTSTGNLAGATFTVSGAGAATMRGFKIGVNGGITANVDFAEYAAVAICDTWCGPYQSGQ